MMRRTPANSPESRELAERHTHPPSFYQRQRTEMNHIQARARLELNREREQQRQTRSRERRNLQRQAELMRRYLR